jgi:hypothetical protein
MFAMRVPYQYGTIVMCREHGNRRSGGSAIEVCNVCTTLR